MTRRQIIKIDESKCNGCGLCVPACKEGALKIIDGKAKLVSEIYCDGLGACLGECPQGAITIEEREAPAFDEVAVERHLKETTKAQRPTPCQCPSSIARTLDRGREPVKTGKRQTSQLSNWPIQLMLIPPEAPYLTNADIVLLADCTAVACANLHSDILKGRVIIMACPKLDDAEFYVEKLTHMLKTSRPRSIEVVMMEVPCCAGLKSMLDEAVRSAKIDTPIKETIISIEGERLQ